MKVVTTREMQELDRRATAEYGVPSLLLMENAGREVVREMEKAFPRLGRSRVGIVCGKGNNGGDGCVVARHLVSRGVSVVMALVGRRADVQGDARITLEILEKMGIGLHEVTGSRDLESLRTLLRPCDILVDALLGTGLTGEVRGLPAEVIALLNDRAEEGTPIVSVDVPSGLPGDEAVTPGLCVRASLTVTLGLPKRSLVLYPTARFAGRVVVADIGMPRPLLTDPALPVSLLESDEVAAAFPPREADSHKGTYGHLLVIAGSVGKTGAAALCGMAALRVGAGLVTVAVPESLHDIVAARVTEVMTEPLPETSERTVAVEALERVLALAEGKKVVALGPGLSTEESTGKLVRELVQRLRIPLVIDADGLNNLAEHQDLLDGAVAPRVLTPHPGEFSRLFSVSRAELTAKRIPLVQEVARRYRLSVVLKGARTLVADPQGEVSINPTGNPGMASAGMGDLLTGIIAGLLAQGREVGLAARAGVYLHGLAGDLAAARMGQEALVASDLLTELPEAIRRVKGESG